MNLTRRAFLGTASAAAIAAELPSARPLRLGLIGCGSRALQLVTETAGERLVAFCDPDATRFQVLFDRLAALGRGDEVAGIRTFGDWHEMFDRVGGGLDAVIIATPNHQHVHCCCAAMRRGIHVYLEKPMALTIEEVRHLMSVWRRHPVATQVGNHGHSWEGTRLLVEYVRSGAIGQVHDVWCWDCRVNAFDVTPPERSVPPTFDWEAWQGPALPHAFHDGIHLHDWHYWRRWGNGSIGNTGTHQFDPVFWALRLGETPPTDVELVDFRPGAAESWNVRNTIQWTFPARPGLDPVRLHWFDGLKDGVPLDAAHLARWNNCTVRDCQNIPEPVLELSRRHQMDLGREGVLVVGEKGVLRLGSHGDGFMFVPKDLRRRLGKPPCLIPRERGFTHMKDFFRAARGERPAGCNFAYSAPIAETVLLGNVAVRAGRKKLLWDGVRVTNDPSANAFLRAAYRPGWTLPEA